MFIAVLSIDWGTLATALVMSIVAARAPLLPKYSLVFAIQSYIFLIENPVFAQNHEAMSINWEKLKLEGQREH